MNVDLIIETRGQFLRCASAGRPKKGTAMRDLGIAAGGAVAVKDGQIVAAGQAERIRSDHYPAEIFDAGDRVVCPGFVDPHTHIVFGGNRLDEFELRIDGAEYLEILKAGGGILSTVKSTREASRDELFEGGMRRLDKMLRCGTTTAEIKTGYGLDLESELKMLGVIDDLERNHPMDIVPTFLAAHAVPAEHKSCPGDYVRLICESMLPAAWSWYKESDFFDRTPFFVDVFTERNAFDLGQTREILTEAKKIGFGIKVHVDEFTNLGGSRVAMEMGAVSIDHLDAISPEEIEMLATSNTIGIVTPTVNFNLGSGRFADARRLVDSGCAVALSTDFNPGSAPCPSQQMVMAIACRYQKLLPAEAFAAATINAAYSCGVGDRTGSLEAGKSADVLVLDTQDLRQLAYEFGGNLVSTIFKSGKMIP